MNTTSLASSLLQQLQGGGIQQLASQLGIDNGKAESAVASAVPLLLGALGRNAQQPGGADALLGALQRDHAGAASGLDLGGLLGSILGGAQAGAQTDGAGILGHIFGGKREQVASGLGQATGLDSGKAGQLLQALAPIVMSFLAQRFLGNGQADTTQVSQVLGQEHAQAKASGAGDLLGSLLDQDGDGQFGVSDLLKLGGGLFGAKS